MTRPTIHDATPADAAVIHRFIVELAVYEREPGAVEVTPATLREQLAADPPPFGCLLAALDGEPAGMALFFRTYSTWRGRTGIHLEDLLVTERHRRRGVGSALVRALARLTRDRGCARLEWAVLDWNAPAIAFYEHLGGAPLPEWTTWRLDGPRLAAVAAA